MVGSKFWPSFRARLDLIVESLTTTAETFEAAAEDIGNAADSLGTIAGTFDLTEVLARLETIEAVLEEIRDGPDGGGEE